MIPKPGPVGTVTETYTYDAGDKLQSVVWPGGSKTYTYDAAGRTTQVVAPNGTTNIVYDFESRITSLTGPGITQTSVYNGLDTRVSTTVNNSTRAFGRDGVYVTDPVLTHGTDTSFTPGISERRSGTTTFLHSGLKNADAQSSTAQAITATRTYDAFGMIRNSSGTWRGPFGYAGGFGYQEDASGLRLLGHRYYDASTGRFLTRDPIKDGRNWYAYGAGEANPLSGADPTGLGWHDPMCIYVHPEFEGTVTVVGEPGPGQEQVAIIVPPGHHSPPGMDVDYIRIQDKDGNDILPPAFLPGWGWFKPGPDMATVGKDGELDTTSLIWPLPPFYEWEKAHGRLVPPHARPRKGPPRHVTQPINYNLRRGPGKGRPRF